MIILNVFDENQNSSMLQFNPTTCQLCTMDEQPVVATAPMPFCVNNQEELNEIRIQLGLACNFSCTYCNQNSTSKLEYDTEQIRFFCDNLTTFITEQNIKHRLSIQLWGGEPLLYFNEMRQIVNTLSNDKRLSGYELEFATVTNGSLLTDEITDFLIENKFCVSISNDGPNQTFRTQNSLVENDTFIHKLLENLREKICFSVVLNKDNSGNISELVQYFKQYSSNDHIVINEGVPVTVTDATSLTTVYHYKELELFKQLLHEDSKHFQLLHTNIFRLVNVILKNTSDIPFGGCVISSNRSISVDLDLNVIPCQSFNAQTDIASTYKLNSLDPKNYAKEYKTDEIAENCVNCPVYFFCHGGCPYNKDFKEQECKVKFNFYIQCLQYAIYLITNKIVYQIDGDFYRNTSPE